MRRTLAVGENIAFTLALFFLVPPVPSNAGDRYSPAYLICGSCMAVSRLLAYRGGRDTIAGSIVKVIVLLVTAWAINVRVFEY